MKSGNFDLSSKVFSSPLGMIMILMGWLFLFQRRRFGELLERVMKIRHQDLTVSICFAFKSVGKFLKRISCNSFKEFYDNGCLAKGINSSFITLLPKNENLGGVSDYRPISLIGSLYKILSKVLASRLKKVLPKIIGESQSAFIGGRNILDGILVSNEVVDWWKRKKKKG